MKQPGAGKNLGRSTNNWRTAGRATDHAGMLVVHVHVHVKPECVDAFIAVTRVNALASLEEPGIARFDVVQQVDDPTRFVLVEAYKTAAAPAQHKQTAHYATWREAVADMMHSPRSSVKFESLCPEDARWSTPSP